MKKLIDTVNSVHLSLNKSNPPQLVVTANGNNPIKGWHDFELDISFHENNVGTANLNFVGLIPIDHPVSEVTPTGEVSYTFKNIPKNLHQVTVNAEKNSITIPFSQVIDPKSLINSTVSIHDATAWVDAQPIGVPVLHVIGTVLFSNHAHGVVLLKKAEPQGINPDILILEIVYGPEMILYFGPAHIRYQEPSTATSSYSSIEIHYQGKKLATIDHIPTVW